MPQTELNKGDEAHSTHLDDGLRMWQSDGDDMELVLTLETPQERLP